MGVQRAGVTICVLYAAALVLVFSFLAKNYGTYLNLCAKSVEHTLS